MVGAVLGLFVRPLQRNEARHVRRVHAAARAGRWRGGGGAAAGRRSGEPARGRKHCPRPSIGHALPRQGHRSRRNGTCNYTGQCMRRNGTADKSTIRESSSSKPSAARCLLAPDLIRESLPVSPRTPLLPALSHDRYWGQSGTRPRPRLAALMQAGDARGRLHRPRHLTCAPECTSHVPYNPIPTLGARLPAQAGVASAIHRHSPCARLAALMQLGVCGSGPGAFGRDLDLIRARIRGLRPRVALVSTHELPRPGRVSYFPK